MRHLQEDYKELSLDALRQAEAVVLSIKNIRPDHNEKLFVLTLNNFGCYYKK